jgi:cytochrome c oxidase assembly protein subunit 11
MTVNVGQTGFANYIARSVANTSSAGVAVYNVSPPKAGKYFVKTQCFCFNDQTLAPGQAVDMPVIYFVDPKMLSDPNMQDVKEITLSYRFYPAGSKALDAALEKYQSAP